MCQGRTTHIANGTPVALNQGELLFFGQGAKQEILPAGAQDIAVNFIILPQFFDKVLKMLDADRTPLRVFLVESLGSGNIGIPSPPAKHSDLSGSKAPPHRRQTLKAAGTWHGQIGTKFS